MTDEQISAGAQGGARKDAGGDETQAPVDAGPSSAADETAGEEAWKNYPREVEAAIAYAGSNKYDYGPKLRDVELDYTVVSARPMSDEITRVVLSYHPKTKFRGKSGSEYLDVDRNGEVQARRQIQVPKESMPWVLVGLATLSVIAAAVLVPFMLINEDQGDSTFVAGRTLWVRSGQPRIQPYLTYDALDSEQVPRKWIIVPEGDETSIAFVNLTLINQTSGVVNLSIDTDAVDITTEAGITIKPVDLFARVAWPAAEAELDRRYNLLDLPLWGSRVLRGGEQLSGFVAFEVPNGSKIRSLRWAATDVANIRY